MFVLSHIQNTRTLPNNCKKPFVLDYVQLIEDWEVTDMNWKKLILIAIAVVGIGFAAAPRANAGVAVGIGFGYPGPYPYPYYGYPYPYGYYGPSVYVGPSFYWSHGRRVYYSRAHRYHHHRYYR
jgi:hypothetical protein